jgi:plastocyanin
MRGVLGALAVAVIVAACGGDDPPPTGNNNGGVNTCTSTSSAVNVSNDIYNPRCTTVTPGTEVIWTWTAAATNTHSVTFNSGSSSQVLGPGGEFKRAFPTTGTFDYHCTVHPTMTGQIKVQ